MKKIITEYAQIVNQTTGEVEDFAVEVIDNKANNNIKRGWNRMYRFEYDRVIREISSAKEYDIFVDIRESNLKNSFFLNFNQSKLAKKHNTSRQTVARVIKKLKDNYFIKKINNNFIINPLIYIPPMVCNEAVLEAKKIWEDK